MVEKLGETIQWNIINSILAGALVLIGGTVDGHISLDEIWITIGASFIVALTKFREFWMNYGSKPRRLKSGFFNFI